MAKADKYCSQEIDDNISLYLSHSFSAVTKANLGEFELWISDLGGEVCVLIYLIFDE